MRQVYELVGLRRAIREADEVYIYAHVCEDAFPVLVSKAVGLRLADRLERDGIIMPKEGQARPLAWCEDGQVYIG